MLFNILITLSFLASALGAAAALLYLPACSRLETYIKGERPKVLAEDGISLNEAFISWRERRRSLDSTRLRIAVLGLFCYAVGMFSTVPLSSMLENAHESKTMVTFFTVVLTVSMLTVAIRSMFHNDRTSTSDMERQFSKYN